LHRKPDEVPLVALVTAALFVASSVHVRLGPSSTHLLLNGLAGVVLGRRVPLAVACGLVLQAVLLGHGGYDTLGVNICVLSLPALVGWGLFAALRPFADRLTRPGPADFALGLLVGSGVVLLTALLNATVLYLGGAGDFRTLARVIFLTHLPLAGVEGVVLGSLVAFLRTVKPELLGLRPSSPG
jgi:cobalt/nickel transport system permease protein